VTRAYVALGSNVGDRMTNLAAALCELGALPGVTVVATSRVYESEPWGGVAQPGYANAVVEIASELGALSLLQACKGIERAMGREPGVRFGPRTIDLDLLLFGDAAIDTPELTVPHARMLERDFVVTPLLEIASDVRLPDGSAVEADLAVEGRVTGVLGRLSPLGDRSS
jgi:2-amino-4-hydroxy-6-hydroxymethyldihydropteridine diphosphokinase